MRLSRAVLCIMLLLPGWSFAANPKPVPDKIAGNNVSKERPAHFALVLLVDKSASMAQDGKIQSVRQAALQAVQALADDDYFSLIAFDHAPFIVMDLRRISQAKELAAQRTANLYPAGQTNLLPALSIADQKLRSIQAMKKHIVLVSDETLATHGHEKYYLEEISNAKEAGITLSCFAIGQDGDFSLLKLIAESGKGSFYRVSNAPDLPQAVVNEIRKAVGKRPPKSLETQRAPISATPVQSQQPSRGSPPNEKRVPTPDKPDSSPEPPTDMSDVETFSPMKRYSTASATKVYSAPSASASSIGEVDADSVVEVKRRVGTWLELRSVKGRAGYIRLKDATAVSPAVNSLK